MRCETSFSKLKYIFNLLCSRLLQEILDNFLLVNMEKDVLSIDNIKNEDIMNLLTPKSELLKTILTF